MARTGSIQGTNPNEALLPNYLQGCSGLPGERTEPPQLILCDFSVPGEPVPKGRPRFDARHMRTYTPAITAAAEWRMLNYLKVTYPRVNPCTEYVTLELRFFLKGTGRGDLDNYVKLVSDSLNGVVYRDDKQVRQISAELIDNSTAPRTEITVYQL